MNKVKLTLSRLAAMSATGAFCLLATSCGKDEPAGAGAEKTNVKKEYKAEAEAYRKLAGADVVKKSIDKAAGKGSRIGDSTSNDTLAGKIFAEINGSNKPNVLAGDLLIKIYSILAGDADVKKELDALLPAITAIAETKEEAKAAAA